MNYIYPVFLHVKLPSNTSSTQKLGGKEVDPKAKGNFLRKIVTQGFSIVERENQLTLRPRGLEETAEITIEEVEPDVWKVVHARGQYVGFARGKKREFFEAYIKRWATQAALEAL